MMGWRYNRRIKILPGVHLNLGKTGHSWSFGKKGVGSLNYNPKTKKLTNTVDTPITGLSYRESTKLGASKHDAIANGTDYTYTDNQPITNNSDMSGNKAERFFSGVKNFFQLMQLIAFLLWNLAKLAILGFVIYWIIKFAADLML